MLDLDIAFEKAQEGPSEAQEATIAPQVTPTYEDFNYDDLQTYAGLDCIATSELLARLMPAIAEEEVFYAPDEKNRKTTTVAPAIIQSVLDIEMVAHEFIVDLEINGIHYDVEKNRIIGNQMREEISVLEDRIFSQIGKKLEFDSGAKIADFLYNERGFKPPSTTKSGEPATDGDALMTLAGLEPLKGKYVAPNPELQWLADMAKRKDISSVYNSFIATYVEDWVKRDGRIHPSYNLHGTSSFRITGSDPNLTQLPRPKHGYNVRVCYDVETGKVFISFDFSSAEVKILANLSKEPAMLKAIADGLDFHAFSASEMNGIPYDEFIEAISDDKHPNYKTFKNLRTIAKVLTFSLLYGSSVGGIAMQLFLETSEAQRLVDLYFTSFPGVRAYIESTHLMAQWNNFILTPFGQRKRAYGAYPCFKATAAYNASLRNAQNVSIQSPTSTLGLIVFANLNEAIKPFGAKSICTVYDSIEIEAPINRAAEVIETCYYYLDDWPLEQFKWLELPIGCEGDIGFNWGETKIVHRGVTQAHIDDVLAELRLAA